MISQVSANYNNTNNTEMPRSFNQFNTLRSSYYFTAPLTTDEDKKHKSAKLGVTIATSALVVGFGVLALMKGLPKGFTQKINNLRQILEEKVAKFSDDAKSSRMTKFYEFSLKKAEKASEYLNSVNNASAFKDILFAKLMRKTKPTQKIAEKITSMFERFSRKTVIGGYNNAYNRFNRMYEVFGAADNKIIAENADKVVTINGKTLTAKEWLKIISGKKIDMSQAFNSYFGKDAVNMRYQTTKKSMEGLEKKVWDLSLGDLKNNYKNKEVYDTFLPEAVLAGSKSSLKKQVNRYRNIIAGNPDKPGQLDEVMTIYKHLLSPGDYQKLERYSSSAVKKLDRAVLLETDKFFDKLRDLELGSAPTDFLSMVTGLATVGIGLTKAEDNDERVSVSLKYGIPALSAIATSLYLGATLVSGGSALVLATLSGMLTNKIGTEVDEYRQKQLLAKQSQTAEFTAKAV